MSFGKLARGESIAAQAAGPLFVVSMWRSGSSLLYALLNKHPQVGLMFEADLALLQPLFLKPEGWQDWPRRWEFWNQALTRHQLRAQDIPAGITGFRAAFTLVHQQYARRKGATIWGDKSPNYYDRLREIAEIFPDARFIIVWRDPADTISSMVRAGQLGSAYFGRKGSALRGLLGCPVLKQQCDELVSQGKPVLQLNYEDLVNQPAAVMRGVCGFLKISYTDHLSSLRGADRSAIYDYGSQHHALVKGDQIVSAPRPDAIDPALRRKIAAYIARWRGLSPTGPKLLERILDQLTYLALRAYDRLTALAFCVLPLSLLSRYRTRKYGLSGFSAKFRRLGSGASFEVNP
ncbi:hypothetical protein SBA7_610012 [Candidatus Sulfotelmatobacter sp. SbA7]|nr:hypothetical protein SBA7_610012 [Candidatus Sulfotelmatobacter sp. SbA7]